MIRKKEKERKEMYEESYPTQEGSKGVSGWLPHALQKIKIIQKIRKKKKDKHMQKKHILYSPVRSYVGVGSRLEFLDSTVRSDVFNAVAEGSFVL